MDSPTTTGAPPAPRCSFRIPRPVEVLLEKDTPRFLGYVSNLSETGMFVQCSNPRGVGTRLALILRLPGHPDGVRCRQVEVIWTRGYTGANGPSPGMGTRFVELDPPAADALRSVCDDPAAAEARLIEGRGGDPDDAFPEPEVAPTPREVSRLAGAASSETSAAPDPSSLADAGPTARAGSAPVHAAARDAAPGETPRAALELEKPPPPASRHQGSRPSEPPAPGRHGAAAREAAQEVDPARDEPAPAVEPGDRRREADAPDALVALDAETLERVFREAGFDEEPADDPEPRS